MDAHTQQEIFLQLEALEASQKLLLENINALTGRVSSLEEKIDKLIPKIKLDTKLEEEK